MVCSVPTTIFDQGHDEDVLRRPSSGVNRSTVTPEVSLHVFLILVVRNREVHKGPEHVRVSKRGCSISPESPKASLSFELDLPGNLVHFLCN